MRPPATLVIKNGEFAEMRFELRSDETLIGRNPTTDITLLDEGLNYQTKIKVF